MDFFKNNAVALVALIIAIAACFLPVLPNGSSAFGTVQSGVDISTTNYTTMSVTNGFANGGVFITANRSAALVAATTTPCAFQAPAATSTVMSASLLETVSSTTASSITIATAATQYATTTPLNATSVSAGAQTSAIFNATSSSAVISPSQWVVFGQSGGAGTFSSTGVCTVVFQVLN